MISCKVERVFVGLRIRLVVWDVVQDIRFSCAFLRRGIRPPPHYRSWSSKLLKWVRSRRKWSSPEVRIGSFEFGAVGVFEDNGCLIDHNAIIETLAAWSSAPVVRHQDERRWSPRNILFLKVMLRSALPGIQRRSPSPFHRCAKIMYVSITCAPNWRINQHNIWATPFWGIWTE